MTYDCDDDILPDVAQKRYSGYLATWYGSQAKAEFEQRKNDEAFKAKYDPRALEKALERRNEEAREAADRFFGELAEGKFDPSAAGFNQGSFDAAAGPGSAGKAPMLCHMPDRIVADYRLSRKLAAKADAEKGVKVRARG